jgi:phosphoesterase RecJ-like protein
LKGISENIVNDFKGYLNRSKRVGIFTHMNPDGDAIGSALAFDIVLKSLNVESKIFIANELPESLQWLAGAEQIHTNAKIADVKKYLEESDLLVCLDFNEPGRVDQLSGILKNTELPVIVIDHHPQVASYKGLLVADTSFSSTAELLYWLLKKSDLVVRSTGFAENIYTGIVTDTGSFAYNSSSPYTFQAVADLLEIGFDKDRVTDLVFQQFEASRIRLLGHLLVNRLEVIEGFGTAYTYLTKEDLNRYEYKSGDTEGFVNYPLSIKGVYFTAFFIENEDHIKISFRSKGDFPANTFSNKYFHGGGHLNAAGGRSYDPLYETLEHFEKLVKQFVNEQ